MTLTMMVAATIDTIHNALLSAKEYRYLSSVHDTNANNSDGYMSEKFIV